MSYTGYNLGKIKAKELNYLRWIRINRKKRKIIFEKW